MNEILICLNPSLFLAFLHFLNYAYIYTYIHLYIHISAIVVKLVLAAVAEEREDGRVPFLTLLINHMITTDNI